MSKDLPDAPQANRLALQRTCFLFTSENGGLDWFSHQPQEINPYSGSGIIQKLFFFPPQNCESESGKPLDVHDFWTNLFSFRFLVLYSLVISKPQFKSPGSWTSAAIIGVMEVWTGPSISSSWPCWGYQPWAHGGHVPWNIWVSQRYTWLNNFQQIHGFPLQ